MAYFLDCLNLSVAIIRISHIKSARMRGKPNKNACALFRIILNKQLLLHASLRAMDSSLEHNQHILEEDYDENYEPTEEGDPDLSLVQPN